jgi:hypothetical protein
MLYVADRLLDVQRVPPHHLRDRHWFHARHAWVLLAGLGIAALSLTWIVVRGLPGSLFLHEFALGAAVLLYFAAIHLPALRLDFLRRLPMKEVIVAVIFSTAVTIPAWTLAPYRARLLIPAMAFAVLCGLNCLTIEAVEQGPKSCGISATACERLLLVLAGATAGFALTPWIAGQGLLLFAIAIAALLLFISSRLRERIPPLTFRTAADAALLTPILFVPWHWLFR